MWVETKEYGQCVSFIILEHNGWPASLLTHNLLLEWKACRQTAKDKDKVRLVMGVFFACVSLYRHMAVTHWLS